MVGASRDPGSFGQRVVRFLAESGFQGLICPVNPKAKVIHSLPCYSRIEDLPEDVDLAVIVVPAPSVAPAVERCARRGIKAVVVISAGFKEVGERGEQLEEKLTRAVRKNGMKMIGPNCMGVINTDPDVRMNATFAPADMSPGRIAFMSQSGAMGVAILKYASELSLGLSMFASIGNKADVSANDLLEYWRDNPRTEVILLYMESFGNPRRFTQIARTITPQKPIIAVKAGRTVSGVLAVDSHTGERTEQGTMVGADLVVDALFEQCGVIRVETLEEMFDLTRAIINQPLPGGAGVAVLTNGGGPGIMAADALEGIELEVPPLDPRTLRRLEKILPPHASVQNPVDMGADAGGPLYHKAIPLLLDDPNIDVLLVIFVGFEYSQVAEAIITHARRSSKPVLACMMGGRRDDPGFQELQRMGIPAYSFPETACRVIRQMLNYRRYREREYGKAKVFKSVDRDRVRGQVERARSQGRVDLTLEEIRVVAESYGVKITRESIAHSDDEAARAAEEIGYPVVVKILSSRLRKKSDVGGVMLDLRNEIEVRRAYQSVLNNIRSRCPAAEIEGVVVQEMLQGGHELIIGSDYDPTFGPLIKIGAGGPYADLNPDFQFRIVPITPREALEMIKALKIYPLLEGTRGRRPIHVPSLVDLLCRASQIILDFEEIRDFEINPLIVFPRRRDFWAVDGRVRLFEPQELKARNAGRQ